MKLSNFPKYFGVNYTYTKEYCTKSIMAMSVICDLFQIFKSSYSAVLPDNLVRKTLKYNPANHCLTIFGDIYNIQGKNVYLVGAGKAVRSMAIEVENILCSKIKQGIISIPEGSPKIISESVMYAEGAKNNLPDINAVETSKIIMNLATANLQKDDILLVLISGGGSALLSLPKPPITLDEKTKLIKKLANSGADITELNTVRKRLSNTKGGKLAIQAQPAQVVSLILSDIVGDPIDLIASGPTVEDEDEPSKAINIIKKYNLFDSLPNTIKIVLSEINKLDFPKENVKNYIIGSNQMSIKAAMDEARKLNYAPIGLSNSVTGNIVDIAHGYIKLTKIFCEFLRNILDVESLKDSLRTLPITGINYDLINVINIEDKDLCLILGGETTVQVKGSGKGGRNQQLALEFSKYIHNCRNEFIDFNIYLLCAGTDGIDGPTDAAGAIGYLELVTEAEKEKVDVETYLQNSDSYNFYKDFKEGKLHVITGHTGTNVMDIHLILIKKKRK